MAAEERKSAIKLDFDSILNTFADLVSDFTFDSDSVSHPGIGMRSSRESLSTA
jgi:hypothetical protein